MVWATQVSALGNSTEAALSAIAAAFVGASDRYARDYDANLTKRGPAPFQIPGVSGPMPARPRWMCHLGCCEGPNAITTIAVPVL